jgi:NADH-ubiquinone oxidoreductase chain 2
MLSLSLAITIFSFIGIPPLIGFFGKQMVLSAALDKGYIFLVLIAIVTSVISAVYYLNIIKETFFYSSEYKKNIPLIKILGNIYFNFKSLTINSKEAKKYKIEKENIELSNIIITSPIAFTISTITLIILLFIFMNKE